MMDKTVAHQDQDLRQALSALVDGEASEEELSRLLDVWAERPSLRREWQTYQMLGDALRSDELVQDGRRGQLLLERLRPQLAGEARVLAPGALATKAKPSVKARRWVAPAAVAAGFMLLVAGMNSLSQLAPRPSEAVLQASAPQQSPAPMGLATQGLSFAQSALSSTAQLVVPVAGPESGVLWREPDAEPLPQGEKHDR